MKRPARAISPLLTVTQRESAAMRAIYTGSAEHKDRRSWLGLPQLRQGDASKVDDHRQNATICPLVSEEDRDRATQWVQQAIRNSQFDPNILAGDFPRNICDPDADGN